MKYIKIKGYDNWFWHIKKGETIDFLYGHKVQERLVTKVIGGIHNPDNINYWDQVCTISANNLDYQELIDKADHDILVQPIGSYMYLLDDMEIVETREAEDFPVDRFGSVVVCENDHDMPYEWHQYLKNRFPKLNIVLINHFRTRDDKTIREYFRHAKYVTFTTTFTSMDWWELLVKNLYKKNQVIGRCNDDKNWAKAMEIYNDVERVRQRNR